MSRRKQNDALEGLYDVFVAAPWWMPLPVVAVVYGGIHYLPALFPAAVDPHTGAPNYGHALAVAFAPIAPTAATIIFLVGEAYRRQGYNAQECGGGGPDGGIDLVLRRAGKKTLVQCKHWKVRQVGVSIVRELYGVMVTEKADAGIVVTMGEFTADAGKFAQGKALHLINGTQLLTLVQQGQTLAKSALPMQEIVQPAPPELDMPSCTICQGTMIRRLARKGANAGGEFWGCAAYPQCRGTRPL